MMTFFAPGRHVALGLLTVGEQTGRLDHEIDAELFPGEAGGIFGADDADLCPVNHQHIVFGLVRGRLLGANLAGETALGGIVLEQVGEVVRRDDIADRDDLNVFADQPLFEHRAKHQPSNASESIDCNFNCHKLYFSYSSQFNCATTPKFTDLKVEAPTVNDEFGRA